VASDIPMHILDDIRHTRHRCDGQLADATQVGDEIRVAAGKLHVATFP
jgi:hypothetical protein